mmetsp:Transcript_18572/g.63301  ORF Transcript_18572/g.63301 Transcript_18572/m.63301 type:complete len:204 (+) Transcript_18572:1030-1641(+)
MRTCASREPWSQGSRRPSRRPSAGTAEAPEAGSRLQAVQSAAGRNLALDALPERRVREAARLRLPEHVVPRLCHPVVGEVSERLWYGEEHHRRAPRRGAHRERAYRRRAARVAVRVLSPAAVVQQHDGGEVVGQVVLAEERLPDVRLLRLEPDPVLGVAGGDGLDEAAAQGAHAVHEEDGAGLLHGPAARRRTGCCLQVRVAG